MEGGVTSRENLLQFWDREIEKKNNKRRESEGGKEIKIVLKEDSF